MMPYETQVSSVNPRLLILLTDESEESVWVINRLIDQQIELNFDGNAPKNRCFISVIGYNQGAKELCSGWLKDLVDIPVRNATKKRITFDGNGLVEMEITIPVWIEPLKHNASCNFYSDAIKIARHISEHWVKNNALSPIVLDCSQRCYTKYALEEIESMKSILAEDGETLFFGCYIEEQSYDNSVFSKIPEVWNCRLNNEYENKTFNFNNVLSFIEAISYIGGESGGLESF
jgi:hypothetical protein